MTRTDDRRLPEEARIAFVSQGKLDLLVSIHCDALEGPRNCTGITTYYRTGRRRGQQLAEALQKRLPAMTGLPNRGAREDTSLYPKKGLYVLRNAVCPAVLVETGYISCAATATRSASSPFSARPSACAPPTATTETPSTDRSRPWRAASVWTAMRSLSPSTSTTVFNSQLP